MEKLFLNVLNLSIVSAWFILAVLGLRLVVKRVAPRWTACLLWGLVALCLVVPFSFESSFSIIPSRNIILYTEQTELPDDNADTPGIDVSKPQNSTIHINSGISSLDDRLNAIIENLEQKEVQTENDNQTKTVDYGKTILTWASYIWIAGLGIMLAYFAYNLISLKLRLRKAMQYTDNVYLDESIGAPFLFGFIKPKIYIPLDVTDEAEEYVLAHERAHIKRFDHIVKPVSFVLLAIHWFNPLVWLAYNMLCRDIEYACDEKVVKDLSEEERKSYASALLECGVKSVGIAYPVAFGEISVKNRIIKTLNYKRPTLWVVLSIIVATAVMAFCFLSSPKLVTDTDLSEEEPPVEQSIAGAWYTADHSLMLEENGDGICYSKGKIVPLKWEINDRLINIILAEEYKSAVDLPTQTDYTISEDGKVLTLGSTVYSGSYTARPRDDIDSALVGTWYSYSIADGETAIYFDDQGTGSMSQGLMTMFSWTAKDGTISVKFHATDKQSITIKAKNYKIDGNKLTFDYIYKQSYSKTRLPIGGNSSLTGNWEITDEKGDVKTLTLNKDGTGLIENKYSSKQFLWCENEDIISFYSQDEDYGDNLDFIAEESPTKTPLPYAINGNKLTVTMDGKDYTLKRTKTSSTQNTADVDHALGGDKAVVNSWEGNVADSSFDLLLLEDGTGTAQTLGIDIPVKWYTDKDTIAIYYPLLGDTPIDLLFGKYYTVGNCLYVQDISGEIICFAKADTDAVGYTFTMLEIGEYLHEEYIESLGDKYLYHTEDFTTEYFMFSATEDIKDLVFTSDGETVYRSDGLKVGESFCFGTTLSYSESVKGVKFTDGNGKQISFIIGTSGIYMPEYIIDQFTIN